MSELPAASADDAAGNGVDATAFLLGLIAREDSDLELGVDGFYFRITETTGADTLIETLDAIAAGGYFINDCQYSAILAFIIDGYPLPEGKLRLGGSLAPLDPSRLEAYEKAIIRDDDEGYFEFFPGAPLPAGRDEFLGVLWKFGICCGIDSASLEATLAEVAAQPGKYLLARSIPAVEGSDAKPVPRVNFQRQRTIKTVDASGHADLHF